MKNNTFVQLRLITAWEFMQFFKWKQEVFSKLLLLALGAVVFIWQTVKDDNEVTYRIAVVAGASVNLPESIDEFRFIPSDQTQSSLSAQLGDDGQWDVILLETSLENGQKQISLYTQEKQAWLSTLQQKLSQFYSLAYAEELGLQPSQLALLSAPAEFNLEYMDQRIKSDEQNSSITAIGMLVLLMLGVFTSFGQLFAGITGEKQQRVTEQLYSCVSAQTWIDGKIFGQLLHGLKAMISSALTALIGFAFFSVVISGNALDFAFLDWSLVPWLFVFAVAGLYVCTAFMAAIAAAIDDPNHSAKTSLMLLPLLPLLLTFLSMDNPSGWALTFLSYFPVTAFAAMPVKMSLIDVPMWQPLVAFALTALLCYWIRGAAGRLFKMGMIMYGKEPSFKDMLRWALVDK